MDLMMPLATIAPGLDSAALTVLAGTEAAMSATQIQRVAGRGSRYGLVLVLERLVDHGLVTAIPAARGSLYQLNRDHVLSPAVIAAVQSRSELDRRLTESLKCLMPAPLSVAVFGSVARGEATPASDIDVVVVVNDDQDVDSDVWLRQINDLEKRFRIWSGNSLQLVPISAGQLVLMVRATDPIVDEWVRDARTIMGEDLRHLIHAAKTGKVEP